MARAAWVEATTGTELFDVPVGWEPAVDLMRCLGCGAEYQGSKLDRCPGCTADGLVVEAAPPIVVEEVG